MLLCASVKAFLRCWGPEITLFSDLMPRIPSSHTSQGILHPGRGALVSSGCFLVRLFSVSHTPWSCTELEEIPRWLTLQSLTQNGWNSRMEKVGCSTNKREGCSSPRCVSFGVSSVCSCVSWSGKESRGFCDLTRLLDCGYRLRV